MKRLFFYTFLILSSISLTAQNLTLPPSGNNQKCEVTQYIGSLVNVSVKYSSPDVTGPGGTDRTGKIWGQLVPYGLNDLGFGIRTPAPWRAGANENTTITFSHDVKINGQPLSAGTYGVHLIVEESGPWTWIFSHNSTAWGSYFYKADEDALRVQAQPAESAFHEWLTYEFTDRDPESAELTLFWENKSISMQIEVPEINSLYVDNMRRELQGSAGFTYQNWVAASQFCIQNNMNLEEALAWAEYAISGPFVGQENFTTLSNKFTLLMKTGKRTGSGEILRKAIEHPTAAAVQIHQLGRQLVGMEMLEKAFEVFEYNFKRYDGAWPTHVGMARGYSAIGEFEEALKHAEKAHEQAPDALNKNALKDAIEKLKNNQDIN